MFIVISLILALALGICLRKNKQHKQAEARVRMTNETLLVLLVEAQNDYQALERGRDEETEAYEQMYLSNAETIGAQGLALRHANEDIAEMDLEITAHRQHCLPLLDGIRAMAADGVPMTHTVETLLEETPIWDSMKDFEPAEG